MRATGLCGAGSSNKLHQIPMHLLSSADLSVISTTQLRSKYRNRLLVKMAARDSDPLIIMAAGDDFEVTDSRDRIYALLGLMDKNNYGLTPDYTLPVEDIYCQFTKRCIALGTGLRLISTFAGAAIRVTAGLPSWCMDFGPGRDDALPFNEVAEAQNRSFATASELPNCLMTQNG